MHGKVLHFPPDIPSVREKIVIESFEALAASFRNACLIKNSVTVEPRISRGPEDASDRMH